MLASLAKRSVQGGERLPLRLPPRAARPPPVSTGGKALCRQRAAALSLKPTVAARSADHDPSLFRCGGHSFHHAPTHATLTHRVEPRAPRFPPCTSLAPERTFEPLASSRAPCPRALRHICAPHVSLTRGLVLCSEASPAHCWGPAAPLLRDGSPRTVPMSILGLHSH